jgi:long-chain acyl-CoA synthetase
MLVLRRIRQAFGGELRYLISGSAAMPVRLLEDLHAMGLLVLEAYGLSECIVPVSTNRPSAYRFGTVGQTMKGNELRLAADGELQLRSTGNFSGYLGQADSSGELDSEGWLATGDLAEIDNDGFIHLVGRKSEVFKTSTGRRVAPSAIEGVLRSVAGVEHAAVFGAGRKSLLAVLSVAPGSEDSWDGLARRLRVALVEFPEALRPVAVVVTQAPFGIDSGELTGNLKLRRGAVQARFSAVLDELAALVDQRVPGSMPDVMHRGAEGVHLLIL